MPCIPITDGGHAEAAREDRFSDPGGILATEQAILLDELIKWIRSQSGVAIDSETRPR